MIALGRAARKGDFLDGRRVLERSCYAKGVRVAKAGRVCLEALALGHFALDRCLEVYLGGGRWEAGGGVGGLVRVGQLVGRLPGWLVGC